VRKIIEAPTFHRDSKKLSLDLEIALQKTVAIVRNNPRDPRLNLKKLRGRKNVFRAKVHDYRLVFRIKKDAIESVNFAPRDQIYSKKHFDLFLS